MCYADVMLASKIFEDIRKDSMKSYRVLLVVGSPSVPRPEP